MSPISKTLSVPAGAEVATYAAGCFWGVEHIFRKQFQSKGLIDAKVGYAGGHTTAPTYRQVCGGDTGHAESLQVSFDPKLVSFATLTDFFFRIHDPTTLNYQGPDVGTQYRSAVFYHDDNQRDVAKRVAADVSQRIFQGKPFATVFEPIKDFYDAEEYHQLYLDKNPAGYECPTHYIRGDPNFVSNI
ncbi:hypothetical protein CANCADRAFT_57447 [Tortispora caseinolytica NRRL Y-17796]|uniref:peptide-methionine (S)-S-oxide reductase n=1 Tax=Tortispora caseinolytica NRRL Y-17796 TaxID=767744 RepID=A0A1E4TH58_9ASCO|nr:hypothetical protein CANCADRAFT_57447 [Tortispora caseinolytica NRRL Y-17796]